MKQTHTMLKIEFAGTYIVLFLAYITREDRPYSSSVHFNSEILGRSTRIMVSDNHNSTLHWNRRQLNRDVEGIGNSYYSQFYSAIQFAIQFYSGLV